MITMTSHGRFEPCATASSGVLPFSLSGFRKALAVLLGAFLTSACATTHPTVAASPELEAGDRLRIGDRIEGELDEGGRRNLKDGSAVQVFQLVGSADTGIEIEVWSGDVETILTLYSPSGSLIATSGESRTEEQGPRLQTLLTERGTHLLVVSGADHEQLGGFSLHVEELEYREGGPLEIPSEVTGLLHSKDEAMIARNTFVDRFEIELEEPKTIVADMSSESVDAYLFLTDSRGGVILGENDDAHPGTTDARLIMELDPGRYQVLATTFHPESQGVYDLSVRSLEITDGGKLDLPSEVTGRLQDSDPIRPPRGTHYHSYELRLDEENLVIIDMMSSEMDAYLYLYEEDGETLIEENDDRAGSDTDSRIMKELPAGTYEVVATTYRPSETGIYELSIHTLSLDEQGDLGVPSETMWMLGDSHSQPRGRRGALQDRHVLKLEEPTSIQIDMRSDCFDAYLILLADDGGTVLAENDDAGPDTTDARLVIQLDAGSYYVAATSFRPGEEGLYELEINEVDSETPGIMQLGSE